MIAATTVLAAQVTSGWKWSAVAIGLAVLALLWIFIAVTNHQIGWRIWRVVQGADGAPSTSKFQWGVWLVVILFAYTVLWVLRARAGDYGALAKVPTNLLTVLGFSTGTAAGAKGITVGYLQSNRITKTTGAKGATGGILSDDSGFPELAKIQMVGFTFVAVGIFLATLVHQIHADPVQTGLPNIDTSLLVLMGISQGGYLGKKLVSVNTPAAPNANANAATVVPHAPAAPAVTGAAAAPGAAADTASDPSASASAPADGDPAAPGPTPPAS